MAKSKNKQENSSPDPVTPGDPPAPPAEEPKPSAGALPVLTLSKLTGNRLTFSRNNPMRVFGPGPAHCAADARHGWSDYLYHYAKEVELSESDYLAAIEAAGQFKTHEPALAPHKRG